MAVPRVILASRSKARNDMLRNVGIPFETIPASIDESEIAKTALQSGGSIEHIPIILAKEKAKKISLEHPDNTVIGSDQILVFQEEIIQKVSKIEEARDKLKMLRGHEHHLISSVCVARKGESIWDYTDSASLKMKNFNDAFLEDYLASSGNIVTTCVGSYALEENGSWLFEKVDGDIFTIMGMPLIPLLTYLETLGFRP